MKLAIVTDFDGTITTRDVGDFLLLNFGLATQKEIDESYLPGIKIEEWMRKYFSRIKIVNIDEIKKVIKENIKIRDGFKEVIIKFQSMNMPFEVVSGGVDLYIEEVFKINSIKLSGYYGRFNDGNIEYDFLNEKITLSDFKAMRVKYYKNKGYKTIFCGDAANDYKAAKTADITFAELRLREMLEREYYKFHPLDDFKRVMEIVCFPI